MQLELLRQSIDQFATALHNGYESGLEALYESIPVWQEHWPPPTPADLPKTLDQALQNSRTRAYWQGHAYQPKEVLIKLAQVSAEGINLAFGRLFNQELDLASRYSGFTYYLDELLADVRRAEGVRSPQVHYHDDYRAPSLYCTLRFPESDAYFEADTYAQALKYLRAPNISAAPDPERFGKSVKVVRNFMAKNERVWAAHSARLQPQDYQEPAALIVSEYFRYLAQQ